MVVFGYRKLLRKKNANENDFRMFDCLTKNLKRNEILLNYFKNLQLLNHLTFILIS